MMAWEEAHARLRKREQTQLREIKVMDATARYGPDVAPEERDAGFTWVELRLNENALTGLHLNQNEVRALRDKLTEYIDKQEETA